LTPNQEVAARQIFWHYLQPRLQAQPPAQGRSLLVQLWRVKKKVETSLLSSGTIIAGVS
jgi:hypothetical protein